MKTFIQVFATVSLLALPFLGTSFAQSGGRVPPDMSKGAGATQNEYTIPPVNPKSLKPAENHPLANQTVKNLQGETLGKIEHVMIDTAEGKETYAMLVLEGRQNPVPVPIGMLKESETGLVLNATRKQLENAPNFGGRGKSQDFQHHGDEPLNPTTRQGGS